MLVGETEPLPDDELPLAPENGNDLWLVSCEKFEYGKTINDPIQIPVNNEIKPTETNWVSDDVPCTVMIFFVSTFDLI